MRTDPDSGDETLVVFVVQTVPGPHCYVTSAFTAPATAVSLERLDLPVTFEESVEIRRCD